MKQHIGRLSLLLGALLGCPAFAQYEPTWESIDRRPTPGWFEDAKFGIFVHWGPYSVPAYRPIGTQRYASYAEWYQPEVMHKPGAGRDFHNRVYGPAFTYRQFGGLFRAELFDAGRWAALFRRAGARYVVLTAKHHDGFCLWPSTSPYSKAWNAAEIGPRRDLVGELSRAVRASGLRMGLYFSLLEWETPTPSREANPYLPDSVVRRHRIPAERYVGHLQGQLKDLVNAYRPAVIFADGAWDEPSGYWQSREFLAWLYTHAPNRDEVVVNDRWGKDAHHRHGDYFTSEYGSDDEKVGNSHPWEESQGIGGSYSLNRAEELDDYKTSAQLIHLLIDRVSRGGNFLLNVGPAADGTIPVIQQQRLRDIGAWLDINGEAIYGTRAIRNLPGAPQLPEKDSTVFLTRTPDALYVITTRWPERPIPLRGVQPAAGAKIRLLGTAAPVAHRRRGNALSLRPPTCCPGPLRGAAAYVFKIPLRSASH